jgi:hypothetical protein
MIYLKALLSKLLPDFARGLIIKLWQKLMQVKFYKFQFEKKKFEIQNKPSG